ncbi:MAG TPA: iron ABC transporter permease [Candidatus Obscuribacterales bacterium]
MPLRLVALAATVLFAFALSLCVGEIWVSPTEAWRILTSPADSSMLPAGLADILWQIRLPRLLIATVIGIALAVSGYLLQALSHNQLADPYLTGVSSGAGLAVALAMMAGFDFGLVPVAAFLGGLVASLVVALMARRAGGLSVTRLLLSGVALSSVCGALITLIITQTNSLAQTQGLVFWLAGGIAGRSWEELAGAAIYTTIGVVIVLLMSKQIRLLSLGEESAQALGLSVQRAQWILLATAVLMCGSAVAISGIVGFVGLMAPNMARTLFGRDERAQIVASALIGSLLVVISDLAARTLGQGQELPLGTLLALIGGPFFLWLVGRRRGEEF